MIEGVIKVQESKKKILYGVIYYGEKKNQPVPPEFILLKDLDNKKCLFRRDKGKIVEIEVDGKKLQKKDFPKNQSYKSQRERRSGVDTVENENGRSRDGKKFQKGPEFFLNPYHFVDVSGITPRYPFKANDTFHPNLNSGYIDVEMKAVTPLFIPDPEETIYRISDEMLDDNKDCVITKFCKEFLEKNEGVTEVYFYNDFSQWMHRKDYDSLLKKRTVEENLELNEWTPGTIKKVDKENRSAFELETKLFFSRAHKKMKFFNVEGTPVIPSTSLKGMLRSTMEILSNSCFPHDYSKNETLNYLSRRLSVAVDFESKEIRKLKPGIIKKHNNQWYFVELDEAKVLTVVDSFEAKGEKTKKAIYCAKNRTNEIEKISTGDGIKRYIERKPTRFSATYRGSEIKNLKTDRFQIVGIRSEKQTIAINTSKGINQFNRKFPYINLRTQQELFPVFYAIIRKCPIIPQKIKDRSVFESIEKKFPGLYYRKNIKEKTVYKLGNADKLTKEKRGDLLEFFSEIEKENRIKLTPTFKVKEISDTHDSLLKLLDEYNDKSKNKDYKVAKYKICQAYLKTSFDMDTKTQDTLFFKFDAEDIHIYIETKIRENRAIKLNNEDVERFKNVISRRSENLEKLTGNEYLKKLQPKARNIEENMFLVYYYDSPESKYLSYTRVARKPYRYGVYDILKKMEKLKCDFINKLCPACNIFGGVDIKTENKKDRISIAGKVSLEFDKFANTPEFEEDVILKPLAEPKPSFFQFYVLNNRKNSNLADSKIDYDKPELKLGRKIYLNHPDNTKESDYSDGKPTNLNSTVQLLRPGAVFKFKIRYFNLSHYELGLLLNSLNIQYNGHPLDYQIGMGKPLGLGRVKINNIKVIEIDRKKRYSSLLEKDMGEQDMADEKQKKFINIFQRIQATCNGKNFDSENFNNEEISKYTPVEIPGFEELSYISDYKLLKSLNNSIVVDFPIKYPSKREGDEMKGFKWFMEEKKYADQRLFDPAMLGKVSDEKIQKEIPLFNWGQESEK